MANHGPIGPINNTSQVSPVVLPAVQDTQPNTNYVDQSLEPQMVRIRSGNLSYSWLDNFDGLDRISQTNFLIRASDNILAKRTKRFSLANFIAQFAITNINPRNNVVYFTTNGTNLFIATITEDYYSTATLAATALANALNAAVGGPGGFSVTSIYTGMDSYLNIANATPFRIVENSTSTPQSKNSSFVDTGYAFWGFIEGDSRFTTYVNGTLTPLYTSVIVGPVSLVYTRYIDFVSSSILQYTKSASSGNFVPANNVVRLYTPVLNSNRVLTPFTTEFDLFDHTSFNFDSGASLGAMDILLLDEFRQQLYLPNSPNNASWFQMAFTCEL